MTVSASAAGLERCAERRPSARAKAHPALVPSIGMVDLCLLRRGVGRALTLALCSLVAGVGAGCRRAAEPPPLTSQFIDTFDEAALGPWWHDTGGDYRVRQGSLVAKNAYNHPLWLRKRLPENVIIDLDAQSSSDVGDIKIELYGDGDSFDPDRGGYVSTGYVLIFGGWRNSLSVICRQNEHDAGRKAVRTDRAVVPGHRYHFQVRRIGGRIDWSIDGAPFLSWTDPEPLSGPGHGHFAFNDWESEVHFDNLSIRPAE